METFQAVWHSQREKKLDSKIVPPGQITFWKYSGKPIFRCHSFVYKTQFKYVLKKYSNFFLYHKQAIFLDINSCEGVVRSFWLPFKLCMTICLHPSTLYQPHVAAGALVRKSNPAKWYNKYISNCSPVGKVLPERPN